MQIERGDAETSGVTISAARAEFDAEVTYLDTATMGLPPRRSWLALQDAQARWRAGTADVAVYDTALTEARAAYAGLVGVRPREVAVGSQVSVFVGLVAANLRPGSEVLVATGDFTSMIFPFLAQAARGITVREAPLERLADSVTARTTLVAVSAVQSADGRVLDLDALRAATDANETQVLLDTTQAIGWLPIAANQFAYTVCGGYKWLLTPRGTAYFTVRDDVADALTPHLAGWYAGEDPWMSVYGTPLRLASDARRFDVSPAWHLWVAAAPAMRLLVDVGVDRLHAHSVTLANRFRAGVGLPPGNSAIVSLSVDAAASDLVTEAAIKMSARAGRLRLSFHVCNRESDADLAAELLQPLTRPTR